jgi:hypothetical protein
MATTKGKLGEQIIRLARAGNPSHPGIKDEEVWELIGQVVNRLLKTEQLTIDLPQGETIPDGAVIAHFGNIDVEQWKDRSRAKLPCVPIRLPRGMGVFRVGPTDEADAQYIPIPAGQSSFITKQKVMSELLGQVGYEVKNDGDGTYAVFTRDLTTDNVEEVDMELIVMDISHYGEWDPLPVSADMEITIVEQVLQMIGIDKVPDKIIDAVSEPTKLKA